MRHLGMVVSFLLAIGLTACGGGGGSLPSVGTPNAQQFNTTSANFRTSTTLSAISNIAIDAGGPASGSWIADSDFNGGKTYQVSAAINTSRVSSAAPQSVYQTVRYAPNLIYTIPHLTPNGSYNVRLHFAETYFTASGKRVFNIKINGQSVLTNFDTFAQAGGANIAVIKAFPAKADASGVITVEMDATVNNAAVGGIEVISTSSAVLAPGAAINLGGSGTGSWIADTDYAGGWVATVAASINTSGVSNAPPQAVYQSQRVGTSFTYAVPGLTPNGVYNVRLHLVESFFSSAGQRIFSAAINGTQVLTAFDVFKNAGGQNIAIAKSFSVNADASGKITIVFTATVNNASVAGIEITAGNSVSPTPTPTPIPSTSPSPAPSPTSGGGSSNCAPSATNPIFSGCFTGNSPYHHTVANLVAYGGKVSTGSNAIDYWNNGNPFEGNTVGSGGGGHGFWSSSPSDPEYSVSCPSYGTCDAATSQTGKKVHIPRGAAPSPDSDHHFVLMDLTSGQELDMWGGFSDRPGNECEVGTYTAGVLTCSWGGTFPFSRNGLASVPGDSGNAGGVAFGMAGLTAGDILSGHISHALGMLGPCLDNGGIYPGTPGRSSDYPCQGGRIPSGRTPAEPSVPYGALLALKPSVNLNAPPYSNASRYCKIILKAYQEYGFYADDNSSGYGLRLMLNNNSDPGWNTINASMIAGGDASGSASSARNTSCLNRVNGNDLEVVRLNQGNGTLSGGDAMLPPVGSP